MSWLQIFSDNFSTAGSGEACRGQLQIVRNIKWMKMKNVFLRKTSVQIRLPGLKKLYVQFQRLKNVSCRSVEGDEN